MGQVYSFRANDSGYEPPSPGRNGERCLHSEERADDTHESKTDPDALSQGRNLERER
jgi:hypothetical protein